MNYTHFPVLSVMGLFLGGFLVEIFGSKNKTVRNIIVMLFTTVSACLMLYLTIPVFGRGEVISYWMGNWEPVEGHAIGIGYEIDGLNMFFVILVVLTYWLSAVYSIKYMEKDRHLGHYYTLFLMLAGSVLGLVCTGDIFNLYVMVEIMTFAAVALTAFRNKKGSNLEAAFKYLVIGSVGSGFTLTGITLLYMQFHTLNMAQLASLVSGNMTPVSVLALSFMFIGFGVKSFIVPFHTPAADAYMSAPTSISMVFSGMVNKAGVYGMIRLLYMVFRVIDKSAIQIVVVVFGAVTMFIGVTMALAQHDFKRLLAFHSISQIGYVITAIGLCSLMGMTSGLFHAMNHTLFKGLLFLCAGAVLYATGTTDLDKLGGLSKKMPKTTICFLIGAFSISGLPPFNGFASKWMIYQAVYEKAVVTGNFFYTFVTVTAVVVSVMTLASFIKVTQAVFFGQTPKNLANTKEVPFSMRLPMWIMSALCLFGGVFYRLIGRYLLIPAGQAAFNITNYIDAMLGDSTAVSASVTNVSTDIADGFSYWNPIVWLVIFITVLIAVCLVLIMGSGSRGKVLESGKDAVEDGKYSTFFSGEKSEYSHVAGSDLFWGFKHNWKKYFGIMQSVHSGNINDYSLMTVICSALIVIVFTVIFI